VDRESKRRWVLAGVMVAGLLLRLAMIRFPRSADDDTEVYAQLGYNLLHHGTYGFMDDGVVSPSLIRLPGYPLVLAILGSVKLTLLVQAFFDLVGCWLLAKFLWVWSGERAGDVGLALGCLCVFTAAYAGEGMTESLSVFATALGIWALGKMMLTKRPGWIDALRVATAGGLAMMLRPDGALLAGTLVLAVFWYGGWYRGWAKSARAACMVAALLALPLVPWTARNWATFHVFEPLAPRHVNDPGERVNLGFYRWLRTWSAEFATTGNVFWQVGTAPIEMADLPPRAFDSAAQRERTAELLGEYNVRHDVTPALDAKFARLAQQRIEADPLRYYVWVPALRVADMWLRPRTESYRLDVYWWRVGEHPWQSAAAIGLGLLNLVYLGLGAVGLRRQYVPFARWMLLYIVLRTAMLATIENPEPRYTLEAYPMLIVCAACWVGGRLGGRWKLEYVVNAERSSFAELFAESFPMPERGGLEQTEGREISRDAYGG
jgi:hypothetical protein